jgi:hypothetical protein
MGRSSVFYFLLLAFLFGCPCFQTVEARGRKAEIVKGEEKMPQNKIIGIADKKAQEIGFDLKKYKTSVTREENFWIVEYYEKDPNVLGGGVQIWIDDRTNEVVKYLKSQ